MRLGPFLPRPNRATSYNGENGLCANSMSGLVSQKLLSGTLGGLSRGEREEIVAQLNYNSHIMRLAYGNGFGGGNFRAIGAAALMVKLRYGRHL